MAKKIILVTGANRGIGYETIRQLALLGHEVILTTRNEEKGEQAVEKLKKENLNVHFIQLDVTEQTQINAAKEKIEMEFGRLDVLINNAGIIVRGDKNLPEVQSSIWAQTMATNAEGPLRISQAFIPLIPEGGRIINISSGGGSMSDNIGGWSPVYCISKTTLNAITRHLSYYLLPKGIAVNAVCPGWVKTDMGTEAAPRTVEQGAETIVWLVTAKTVETGKIFRDKKEIPW